MQTKEEWMKKKHTHKPIEDSECEKKRTQTSDSSRESSLCSCVSCQLVYTQPTGNCWRLHNIWHFLFIVMWCQRVHEYVYTACDPFSFRFSGFLPFTNSRNHLKTASKYLFWRLANLNGMQPGTTHPLHLSLLHVLDFHRTCVYVCVRARW